MYLFKFNLQIIYKLRKSYIVSNVLNQMLSSEFMNVNVDFSEI